MIEIDLSGRLALVTGSSDGIGNAAARGFLGAGADVAVNGRSPEKVARIAEELRAQFPGRAVIEAPGDVGSKAGCDAVTAQVPRCDILVNNVAVIAREDALDASDETYRELWDINFMSALRMSRFYLPGMLERNWGRILFSGSQRGLMAYKGGTPYMASKIAQLSLARSLADVTRGTRVTVNTVMIGLSHSASLDAVATEMAAAKGRTQEEDEQDFIDLVAPASLQRRLTRPEEIANFMVYLASPLASATNGAVLSAEGGTRQAIW
ncbi:MAG: SDR family oxidoreductase [Novosphingobium sp.]|nr:SDR family oxidoreductase [Novosphingobium sp.]